MRLKKTIQLFGYENMSMNHFQLPVHSLSLGSWKPLTYSRNSFGLLFLFIFAVTRSINPMHDVGPTVTQMTTHHWILGL